MLIQCNNRPQLLVDIRDLLRLKDNFAYEGDTF